MAAAVLLVASLAYWDEQRESTAALNDFADEQAVMAKGITATIESSLSQSPDPRSVFPRLRSVERPGALIVLLARDGQEGWTATDRRVVASAALDRARAAYEGPVRLSREQSVALGLPQRMSVAGLATLDAGAVGTFTVAVVASAYRVRDREFRAKVRLVLGVTLASGLVVAFGGVALRKQRKELELERELAVAEVRRQRDERLVRADKLATMGALATGVAHEISTPLGVIVGRAEQLLPKVEGDERATRALRAILDQGERISRVIRGFLLMARGDAPTFEHADPRSIAEKSVDLVEHRFAKAGVHLRSELPGETPSIACEPRLLEQAVANLLLNACDACKAGNHVELVVLATPERIAFVVTDDGAGIARDISARVIEPFFSTKPKGEGTGLGLAIANEIVHHHNGTLAIAPRQGGEHGTEARIEIPTVRREA